jgi:hypothetical protein
VLDPSAARSSLGGAKLDVGGAVKELLDQLETGQLVRGQDNRRRMT